MRCYLIYMQWVGMLIVVWAGVDDESRVGVWWMSCYWNNAMRMKSFWKKSWKKVDKMRWTWYYISVLRKDIKILSPNVTGRWWKRPSYLIRNTRARDGTGIQLNMEKAQKVFPHFLRQKAVLPDCTYTHNNFIISLASLSRGNFILFQKISIFFPTA